MVRKPAKVGAPQACGLLCTGLSRQISLTGMGNCAPPFGVEPPFFVKMLRCVTHFGGTSGSAYSDPDVGHTP